MKRTPSVEISSADHLRGSLTAPSRLLIYGDYECPYTRRALLSVATVRQRLGDSLAFAFRNFPLTEIHPHALHAALAAEAADAQGKFWEMHDLLLRRQLSWKTATSRGMPGCSGSTKNGFAPISRPDPACRVSRPMCAAASGTAAMERPAYSSTAANIVRITTRIRAHRLSIRPAAGFLCPMALVPV